MGSLRKKQYETLRIKIASYLGKKLRKIAAEGEWTGIEIYEEYGLPSNRQSEMKNPESNGRISLSDGHLTKVITKGLLTVSEIKANVELTKAEQDFLNSKAVEEAAARIKKLGFDPAAILNEWLANHATDFKK
jgi:hypothetical protein